MYLVYNQQFHTKILPKKNESTYPQKVSYRLIHSSFIHNSQKLVAAQVCPSRGKEMHKLCCIHAVEQYSAIKMSNH